VKKTDPGASRIAKRGSLKAVRLLVVEDHADMRTSLAILFRMLGCQARFAADLASARVAAGEERFDVLLSDINLPDGDGWDLLREMVERGQRPATAIAMSGFGSNKDIAESHLAGFDQHLVKPFAPEELTAIVQRAADALAQKERAALPKRKLGHVRSDGGCAPMVYLSF
jgi:DNA-binding response OmpR family regulator